MAKKLIDAGTDLIIGHHPHRLQPVEIHKGKVIAYSLGNFIFDNPSIASCRTIILWVEIDKDKNISYKEIPCQMKNAQSFPKASES
jgi:poly-gamma-glutamate synthesis protein (capsule biosynthesis protein)